MGKGSSAFDYIGGTLVEFDPLLGTVADREQDSSSFTVTAFYLLPIIQYIVVCTFTTTLSAILLFGFCPILIRL